MATNATFTWIPQAGILAQEVWYGRLSDVGATLPPATGWNPGANLYNATAALAALNNLDENTKYQFAVLEHCSTGQAPWSIITQYKLVCPTVTITPHTTSVDVSLSILNSSQFANIVAVLTLSIIQVSTGTTISSSTYSGVAIPPVIGNTFSGLIAATAYNVVVSYQLTSGGASIICSTTSVNTAATLSCAIISFSTSNITTNGFTITPAGLQVGDTYDVSLNGGTSFTIINATQPAVAVTGLGSGQTYTVAIRRNCSNGTSSLSSSQNVTTIVNNFNVVDVWYTCSNPTCNGQAIWATTATIRRVSDNSVIYTYNNNPSIPNGFATFIPGILPGVSYSLTATWTANLTKTNGISAVFLTGNTTGQNWGTGLSTITETITFIGATINNISVEVSSRGPVCSC